MAFGSTGGSLVTTYGLLPSAMENVTIQALVSIITSLYIGAILAIQRGAVRMLGNEKHWLISPIFGAIWAAMWLMWARISPFGRYGIPTPDDLEMFRRILPYVGSTGLDFLIGMTGHAIGKSYDQLHLNHPNEALRLLRLASHHSPSISRNLSPDPSRAIDRCASTSAHPDEDQAIPSPVTTSRRKAPHSTLSAATSICGDEEDEPVWKGPRKVLYGLTAFYGVLSSLPVPMPMPLDSPISEVTPFTVGCALPTQAHPSIDDIVHTLRQFANRAQLVVLPETALALKYAGEKTYAIDQIQRNVSEQYGTYVLLSTESRGGRGKVRNEVTLIGSHGVVGTYTKRSLFPVVESHRFQRGDIPPPTWRIDMSHPGGITKPEWSSVPPFTRPVDFTSLICLDSLHPSLLPISPPPSFLAISAASHPTLANEVSRYAQILAATHSIPAIVCSKGASSAIDLTGRVKHQQEGGKGFVISMAIPWFGDGSSREHTWAEYLGPVGVLTCLTLVTAVTKIAEVWWNQGEQGLVEGLQGGVKQIGQGGRALNRLLDWRADTDYLTDDEEAVRVTSWNPLKPIINLMDDFRN